MRCQLEKELGEGNVTQEQLEGLLKTIFVHGDPHALGAAFVQSISPCTAAGIAQLITECRSSRSAYARWIFRCMAAGTTADAAHSMAHKLAQATGIKEACLAGLQLPRNEDAFVEQCLSSARFAESWAALRRHTYR